LKKDLKDTPFSSERLMIWSMGFTLVFSAVVAGILAYQGKDIPFIIRTTIQILIGVFAGRISKGN
jgi:hypothetical protein